MAGLTRQTTPLKRSVATRLGLPLRPAGLILRSIVLSASVLSLAALSLAFPATAAADPYTVQSGDSLSSIAQRYGLSQGVIEALNPSISSPDLLYVGQTLALPDNTVPVTTSARITHVVQPGDSLSGIAAFYGVDVGDVLALNPGQNPDLLYVGIELLVRDDLAAPTPVTVPRPSPIQAEIEAETPPSPSDDTAPPTIETTPPEFSGISAPAFSLPSSSGPTISGIPVTIYRIQPGDTFSGLSQRFSTTVATLLRFNPSLRPDRLFVDSVFWVPRNGGAIETTQTEPAPTITPATASIVPYVVIPGDSATAIALRNGISFADLQALNPGLSLNTVFIGQVLRIPESSSPRSLVPAAPNENTRPESEAPPLIVYTVKSGDSGFGLAATYRLSLPELAALNPSINFDNLLIGQSLFVPDIDLPPPPPGTVAAGAAPPNMHIVQPGDNLSIIANRFGVEAHEIIALNDGINPDILSVDQELRIPGTMPVPIVSETVIVGVSNNLQTLASRLGLLPHTLLANNPGLGDWVPSGTSVVLPSREGLLVTVQPGDTLRGIAQQFGSSVDAIANDVRNGVIAPNQLIVGQEIVIPINVPDFVWPVVGGIITDGFGLCRSPSCDVQHRGLDISKGEGSAVIAAAAGTVDFAGGSYCCGLGFHVIIIHDDGFETVYAHLNGPPPVFEGQVVSQGETIGYVGTTGYSTGPHLHLEIHHNEWFLDAINYLP